MTAWQSAYNRFILRLLALLRNCVQIRALCTRQQFLDHFSLLSVLQILVAAGDSQIRMTSLIFHEVTGHHAPWHLADSTMSESVHSTGFDSKFLKQRCENSSANVTVFWRGATLD